MAKYKVLRDFTGIKEGKGFNAGEVIELAAKRADEIQENIKANFGVEGILEAVKEKEVKGEAKK
ncbi:hypothetical protein [Lactococcus sp.]|uniref:hypothetical protein n=1 Tax=Lactococcus sp. TaxID=44273 RepID=UPI0035B4471C